MMKNKLYILGLFVLSTFVGNAQEIEVKATILDANNKPLEELLLLQKTYW